MACVFRKDTFGAKGTSAYALMCALFALFSFRVVLRFGCSVVLLRLLVVSFMATWIDLRESLILFTLISVVWSGPGALVACGNNSRVVAGARVTAV